MTNRTLLLIALVCGTLAAGCAFLWIQGVSRHNESVLLVRLKPEVRLNHGDRPTRDQLTEVAVPAQFENIVGSAIPHNELALSWLTSRAASEPVPQGSILLYQHFRDEPGPSLAQRIGAGKRAVAIPVAGASTVGYFVEPESFVDVVGTFMEPPRADDPRGGGRLVTRTLVESVRVLAVGNSSTVGAYLRQGPGSSYGIVTLEMDPLDAQKLIFAQTAARGGLTLVLRNPADTGRVTLPVVDWDRM